MKSLVQILGEVAFKHRLTPLEIRAKTRTRTVSRARREFYYRALSETEFSSPEVAEACDRDHTTVLYGATQYAMDHGVQVPRGSTCGVRRLSIS